MNATRKVKLKDLTGNLTCHICKGYFIDASTIIECLHSFCRACIVKHLEKSEFCPVCDVQLHSSKPLSSVRSDQMLQEIVYKLVPGLFQNEMVKRRQFYKENSSSAPSSQHDSGRSNESYITSDDQIQLSLEYYTSDVKLRESSKRYIKCPAAVSISILKKFIHGKYDLKNCFNINVMYGDRILPDDFLLMDIAYKYSWTQNASKPLQLCYAVQGGQIHPRFTFAAAKQKLSQSTLNINKRRQSIKSTNSVSTETTDTLLPANLDKRITTPIKEYDTSTDSCPQTLQNGKMSTKSGRKRKVTLCPDTGTESLKVPKVKDPSEPQVELRKVEQSKMVMPNLVDRPTIEAPVAGTEFQLRISENGIISARSISSGEEKIIISVPTPLKSQTCHPLNGSIPSRPIEILLNGGTKEKMSMIKLKKNDKTNSMSDSTKIRKVDNDRTICQEINIGKDKPKSIRKKSESIPRPRPKKAKCGQMENLSGKTISFGQNKSMHSPTMNCGQQLVQHTGILNGHHSSAFTQIPSSETPISFLNSSSAFTPGKRLNLSGAINGDIKFANSTSPLKDMDGKGSTTLSPGKTNGSSPKKPPKFFKSRHSGSAGSSVEAPPIPVKLNGNISATNGQSFRTPTKHSENNFERKASALCSSSTVSTSSALVTNTTPIFDVTGPAYRFGLDNFNANMNMNLGMGIPSGSGIPINMVPFVTSNYCSMPFFNNPRTTTNPTTALVNALAMSMPFPYQNQNLLQHLNSNPQTLDLSTKKYISNYVPISPKKCGKIENRTKAQNEPLSLKINKSPKRRTDSTPEIHSNPGSASKHQLQETMKSPRPTVKQVPISEKLSKSNEHENGNNNNNNNVECVTENDKNRSTPIPSTGQAHTNDTGCEPENSIPKNDSISSPTLIQSGDSESNVLTKDSPPTSLYSSNSISDIISKSDTKIKDEENSSVKCSNDVDRNNIDIVEVVSLPAATSFNITTPSSA